MKILQLFTGDVFEHFSLLWTSNYMHYNCLLSSEGNIVLQLPNSICMYRLLSEAICCMSYLYFYCFRVSTTVRWLKADMSATNQPPSHKRQYVAAAPSTWNGVTPTRFSFFYPRLSNQFLKWKTAAFWLTHPPVWHNLALKIKVTNLKDYSTNGFLYKPPHETCYWSTTRLL